MAALAVAEVILSRSTRPTSCLLHPEHSTASTASLAGADNIRHATIVLLVLSFGFHLTGRRIALAETAVITSAGRLIGWLQFLGFSSTSNDSPGRRAATTADLKTYRDSVDPIQDQSEKDSLLRQVWCRATCKFMKWCLRTYSSMDSCCCYIMMVWSTELNILSRVNTSN